MSFSIEIRGNGVRCTDDVDGDGGGGFVSIEVLCFVFYMSPACQLSAVPLLLLSFFKGF